MPDIKTIRQTIMITIRQKHPHWDEEFRRDMFQEWVGERRLTKMSPEQLTRVMAIVNDSGAIENPSTPLPEMAPNWGLRAPGMSTNKQIYYASLMARRYAELKGIPADKAFTAWHDWARRYCKIDHISFCTSRQASRAISIMEGVFIKEFGAAEYESLTGKTWQYRGKAYRDCKTRTEHTRKYTHK